MARPRKQGVDYFALDVDFFNDIKIRKIKRSCGPESVAVVICVLCNIYRDKGYYMKWDIDMPFIISEESGATEDQVSETVSKAIEVGFFNEELAKKNILTSLAIQSRYTRIVKDAKRKDCEISKKYDLSEKDEELPPEETELPPEETTVIPEETGVSDIGSTQSIVKYSIGKKSKEEESISADAQKPPLTKPKSTDKKFGKKEFREILISYSCDASHVDDWLSVRSAKKAVFTETALIGFLDECNKHGFPVSEAVRICAENSWQGFKVEWVDKRKSQSKEKISKFEHNLKVAQSLLMPD